MQKPLVVFAFSVLFGVGIVFGCSAPSPDGSGLAGGKRSSSSSGDTGATSSTSSSGSTNDCTNHEKVDDRPACDQCARAKCCDFIVACDKSADCKAMVTCLEDCKGDETCQLTCQIAHEKGGGFLQEVGSCAGDKCSAECPPPDAGSSSGDPFGDI